MAKNPDKSKPVQKKQHEAEEPHPADHRPNPSKATKRGKEAVEAADDLLDEIDKILEENSEEFVQNYVQRGGQ